MCWLPLSPLDCRWIQFYPQSFWTSSSNIQHYSNIIDTYKMIFYFFSYLIGCNHWQWTVFNFVIYNQKYSNRFPPSQNNGLWFLCFLPQWTMYIAALSTWLDASLSSIKQREVNQVIRFPNIFVLSQGFKKDHSINRV